MFSQDGYPLSDASATTRQKTSLTPAFDTPITAAGGKKRKRDDNTMEDLLSESFVIRPHPSSVFDKPRTLQPLVLLPRSQLSLSCLDLLPSSTPLPQSRLFEAHVKILELEERMGTQPTVLIARLDTSKVLYAIERESYGLYVLCQLGPWVDIHKLAAVATSFNQENIKAAFKSPKPIEIPQESATTDVTNEAAKYSKKKRLAIEAIQSMVKRPSMDILGASRPSNSNPEPALIESQNGSQFSTASGLTTESHSASQLVNKPLPEDNIISQPTAPEIFENVRNQYLDALYLSKASLAYFAKGPLSRARAAFHLDYDSNLDMNEYIGFLESLILSTSLIDKKYRDGVPGCISLLDINDNTADEADQTNGKSKKKRTSKKMKLGKTGLYPTEDSLIRKWWESYEAEVESGAPDSSREDVTKSRISHLRIRETQMQMIIILEVLALQPLVTPSDSIDADLPISLPGALKEVKEKSAKAKKPEHLIMLIDVHIDRLCIWQSVAAETTKVGDDSQKRDVSETGNTNKHTSDILRDFCVDVIAPFFASRLPDHCATINRKLGGPVAITPGRPRLSRSTNSNGQRPGAATKRPVPPKVQRSLKRVLSDDRERRSVSRGPARAISLMRSASIPSLKREVSEPLSLSSIPSVDSQTSQMGRSGLLNSKRFSQREVDLGALVADTNAKAKKQATIEAELKDAISALKRPNRELAGKSLADTAEQRAASASRSARKSKKPVRNPLFQNVQISATPKATRQKDMFKKPPGSVSFDSPDIDHIPASSITRIPQSSLPSRISNDNSYSTIQATPTRKSLSSYQKERASFLPSSPLHVRRSSTQLFANYQTSATAGIQETPVKKRLSEHVHPSSEKENPKLEQTQQLASDSIYKSLGWDDDLDDLA